MSTFSRLYVQSGMVLTSLLAAPSAWAQGTFGPLPNIPGPTAADEGSIRDVILSVLNFVLNFLALVAVVVIVIAGIRLIVSQGEEEPREKAKKTIIYVVAGLIVILLAKVIVNFATNVFNNTIG